MLTNSRMHSRQAAPLQFYQKGRRIRVNELYLRYPKRKVSWQLDYFYSRVPYTSWSAILNTTLCHTICGWINKQVLHFRTSAKNQCDVCTLFLKSDTQCICSHRLHLPVNFHTTIEFGTAKRRNRTRRCEMGRQRVSKKARRKWK